MLIHDKIDIGVLEVFGRMHPSGMFSVTSVHLQGACLRQNSFRSTVSATLISDGEFYHTAVVHPLVAGCRH